MILKKFKENLKIYNFKELLIIFIFSLVLIVPPFLYGGRDIRAKVLLLGLILPLSLLVWKLKGQFEQKGAKLLFVILGVFILWMGISIIWSPEKYQAIETFFIFVAYFFLFFLIFNFFHSEKPNTQRFECLVNYFAYLTIGLGVIISVKGIYLFLNYTASSFRLGSTFGHHLPFGEFITYPLFLGLSLLLSRRLKLSFKILLIAINSLFFITFFFNHCRGAWLSFLVISFLLFLIFRKNIIKKEVLISLTLIFLVSLAGIYVLYQIKSQKIENYFQKAVYHETIKENAVTARLHFWNNALEIFKNKPILGGGVNSYKPLYRKYLRAPFYYSTYPHNFYLKVLAELGIIGFLLFISFIIFIIYYSFQVLKTIRQQFKNNNISDKNNLILIGITGGIFSAMANNFINPGWAFSPYNFVIFFIFSGIILKSYVLGQRVGQKENLKRGYFIILLSLILFLFSFLILFSDFYFQKGENALKKDETEQALYFFQKSLKLNPINPDYNRQISVLYFNLADKNPENKEEFLSKSEYYNKKILNWSYETADINFQGKIYLFWEKYDLAEQTFKKAIESNPSRFLGYLELSSLYLQQERYQEIHYLLNQILPKYKKEYILSSLYIVENKENTLFRISSLHSINGQAYLRENSLEEAEQEFEKALHYFPQNKNAAEQLIKLKIIQ